MARVRPFADVLHEAITSELTHGAATVLPQSVLEALRLETGDELAYEIAGDRVILTKASAIDPFGAFHEWSSEADQRDHADLSSAPVKE